MVQITALRVLVNMNKKKLILLLISLPIVFYTIGIFNTDNNLKKTIKNPKEKLSQSTKLDVDESNYKNNKSQNIMVNNEFSDALNSEFINIYDYNNTKSISNVVKHLRERDKTLNDQETIDEIEKYLFNSEKYPFQVRDLISDCINISAHRNFDEGKDKLKYKKPITNLYYYYQTLVPYCERFNGKNHPFWIFLTMARKGDSLMQLELLRSLYMAIQGGVINPLQTPIKYMQIRDEAINYLKILAHKGVFEAAAQLNIQYNLGIQDKVGMVEKDLLQAYYYGFLADKYDTLKWRGLDDSISDIYSKMSERQQIKADKMVENL